MAALLGAPSARAQSAADRETARALMDEGFARRDKGDHKGALERFEGADALMHVPTTGIEVARERVALGRLIEAREALAGVLRFPAKAGEPAPFGVARAAAQRLDDDLAARIPSLQITVSGADGSPSVTVDGADVPSAALIAPRRMNPGVHTIVARSGAREKHEQVTLRERDVRTLSIDLTPATPPMEHARGHAGDAEEPAKKPDKKPDKAEKEAPVGPRVLTFGGFGLAAAGIVVGTIAGLSSLASATRAKKNCYPDNTCPPAAYPDIDAARTAGNVSTVAFAIGGVGAVIGVAGLLWGRAETSPTGARISPWIGVGSAGLGGRF